jgi:Uma2 family endonuclease
MATRVAAPPVTRRTFTVDKYHQMAAVGILSEDDRVELVEGDVLQKSPIGGRHAKCVDILGEALYDQIGKSARVRIQNPIRLDDDTEPLPDLSVVDWGSYGSDLPSFGDTLLLIEVSDTTLLYERDVKLPIYARAGIREVWIVSLPERSIWRYTEPSGGTYQSAERFTVRHHVRTRLRPELDIAITVSDVLPARDE